MANNNTNIGNWNILFNSIAKQPILAFLTVVFCVQSFLLYNNLVEIKTTNQLLLQRLVAEAEDTKEFVKQSEDNHDLLVMIKSAIDNLVK